MIECASCRTLNPDSSAHCVRCGVVLVPAHRATAAEMRCPAGHPVGPTWPSCPYCDGARPADAAAAAARSTRLEGGSGGQARPVVAAAGGERRTRLEGDPDQPGARPSPPVMGPAAGGPKATRLEAAPGTPRRTVLASASPQVNMGAGATGAQPVGAPAAPAAGRRLVAALAAPGLGAGGSVYAVREGKNTIGSDRVSDICLASDPGVSSEHAVLLYRGGVFYLADRLSTNGVWLNDEELPANGTAQLRDRDRIRCGGVELVFLVVEQQKDRAAGVNAAP